jgi:tetratricopeptide (TPR) repeat protein
VSPGAEDAAQSGAEAAGELLDDDEAENGAGQVRSPARGELAANQGRDPDRGVQQRALEIREAALGADHPDVAIALNHVGLALSALGRHAEALPLQLRALTIHEAALGADHPHVATDRTYLGRVLSALGRHADAEAYLKSERNG